MNKEHKYRMGNSIMLAWMRCGDLRLGQLLVNAVGNRDLFYVEDKELVKLVNEYIDKHFSQ